MVYLLIRFKKQIAVLFALLLLVGVTYWKGCEHGRQTMTRPVSFVAAQKPTAVLPVGVREQVRVNLPQNTVTVQTAKGTKTVTGVRNATISVGDDGDVDIVARPYGFTFEPGLSGFFGPGGGYVGPDVCFAYFHRFDALGGIGLSSRNHPLAVGYLGIGYNPPFKLLSNTDIFIGYSTQTQVIGGIRVAF